MKKLMAISAVLVALVFVSATVFADYQAEKTAARWDQIIKTAEDYAYKVAAKYGTTPSNPENQEKMALLDDLWAEIKEMKEIRSKFNTESNRVSQGALIEDFRQSVFEARAILTEIDREFNDLRVN